MKPTGLIHADGRPVSMGEVMRARRAAHFDRPHEAAAGTRGTFQRTWRPGLRSADADWLYDRDDVVARARDAGRNSVIGASAGHRKINSVVGFRWRLSSKVNARALGISYEAARELRRQIEALFRPYAYGPTFQSDAERCKTFGQLLRMSAAHIFYDGEALGLVEYAADEPTRFKTRLRIADPDRLSNPYGAADSLTMRAGKELNAARAPVAYWIREAHPTDLGATPSMNWRRWDRYAHELGRPQVLHAYDVLRAEQSRGIPRLVAALKSIRGFDKYTDAEIETAATNALFLGFIKSNAGPSSIKESFDDEAFSEFCAERQEHYEENPVFLDGVQVPVLGPDDEFKLETAGRDTSKFDAFVRAILRLIAASLGLTYEELSMDFSQTNYSSARAAMAVAWQEVLAFRGLLEAQIANPFYLAFLEEAFDTGALQIPAGAPDFYEAMDAYAECAWIGPARGVIDPTKEIDAAAARIALGTSTLEKECAEDGEDWEEIAEQKAVELKKLEELGLVQTADGLVLASAVNAATAEQDRQRDERPAQPEGALARVRRVAASPEHAAFLDARPPVPA